MKNIDISIIIVNYNGLHHLKKCMPSLAKTVGVVFEIIVVDNGSKDESVPWLEEKFPRARIIEAKKNLGFGRANELGVSMAKGNWIAFLNNDTQVEPQWLVNLLDLMIEKPEITAACSKLMLMEHPAILNALGGGMSRMGCGFDCFFGFTSTHRAIASILQKRSLPVFFPTAAAMLISKKDFLRVGGFDKSFFMYHEDVDLGWRIWLSGGEVHVCMDSVVHHRFGGTTSVEHGNGWRDRLGMRHNIRSILKCYRKKNVVSVLGAHARLLIKKRAWSEMAHLFWWNLLRLPGTLLERLRIQKGRTRTDEDFLIKGLISDADFPSMSPQIPQSNRAIITQYEINSSSLVFGDGASMGRLGFGWYFVEMLDGKKVRWNIGQGQCWLKVKPNCLGLVQLHLFLPGPPMDETEGVWVDVICGASKKRFEFKEHSGWQDLEMNTQSDSEGIIEIQMASSIWSPHGVFNNGDNRILGCAMDRIEFKPVQESAAFSAPFDTKDGSALSVIIPTYNRKDVLQKALAALKKQSLKGFQVIVVDDGSTDGTFKFLEDWKKREGVDSPFSIDLLRQKNKKQGQARNYGLKSAVGDIIMFIGDDILLEPDCLMVHLEKHGAMNGNRDIAVLGFTDWDRGRMRVSPFLDFINCFGAQFGYKLITPGEYVPFTCFYTSHISIHRSVLGEDPFDACFQEYGWEDIDLGYRLCKQGLKILYVPEAGAKHLHPTSLGSFLNRQKKVGLAIETLLAKHPQLCNNEHLPVFSRPHSWTCLLLPPVWHCLIKCMEFLDQKADIEFSLSVYHWLVSYSFHKGWSERLDSKKKQ